MIRKHDALVKSNTKLSLKQRQSEEAKQAQVTKALISSAEEAADKGMPATVLFDKAVSYVSEVTSVQ